VRDVTCAQTHIGGDRHVPNSGPRRTTHKHVFDVLEECAAAVGINAVKKITADSVCLSTLFVCVRASAFNERERKFNSEIMRPAGNFCSTEVDPAAINSFVSRFYVISSAVWAPAASVSCDVGAALNYCDGC
jgi:hypothetical protein